jgi:parallel beta-helix repeat protein
MHLFRQAVKSLLEISSHMSVGYSVVKVRKRFFSSCKIVFFVALYLICLATLEPRAIWRPGASANAGNFPLVFYVATDGNDNWSGGVSIPQPSRNDGPFATLKGARDAIRARRGSDRTGVTVLVRGGIYRLKETFVLDSQDSGTSSSPMVFRAYPNEQPILTGSIPVIDFKPFRDHIFRADLKDYPLLSSGIRQLFMNGNRQILARFPNHKAGDQVGSGFLYVEDEIEGGSKTKFRYHDGATRYWAKPSNGEVVIFSGPNYWNDVVPIKTMDYGTHTLILDASTSYDIKRGNRYFFQNIFDELDFPGEWYFDMPNRSLFYYPEGGATPLAVSIPILKSLVEIREKMLVGRYKAVPANIRFEGFTLSDCEGTAILLQNANNVLIARNTVRNAGENGIELRGGYRNTILGNDVYEVGASGITVTGGDRSKLAPGMHHVENNYVHHVGVYKKASYGIACWGVGNIVSHNRIHSTPRIGIWFDGNDHIIEYNQVHDVNRETQDSGAIYSLGRDWTKRGNIVRFNHVRGSGGYGRDDPSRPWQSPFYTWGIYLDDWVSGTTVYGNIVVRACNGGIFLHGGRDNIVENNVIIESGKAQMVYSTILPTAKELPEMFSIIKKMGYTKYPLLSTIRDPVQGTEMSGNKFLRNIVYYTDRKAVLYDVYGALDLDSTESDYNTIYSAGLPLLVPHMRGTSDLQWTKWKEGGLDRSSVVADPLFSDVGRGDFTLSSDSPAMKLGFKVIPFERMGPYKDPLRASWPIPSMDAAADQNFLSN